MKLDDHTLPDNIIHTYLFLNDLHLAGGVDPEQGRSSQGESFFYDPVFARFLSFHTAQAQAAGQCLHLVLLGDVFDFLRLESTHLPQHRYSLDTSPAMAVEKLRRIAAGHPEFFQALGCLLDGGGTLEVLPGNHDIELVRQPVQSVFKELVAESCQHPPEAQQIRFHPWMLYLPGAFYAEHGQQHHFINAFPSLLRLHFDQPPGRFRLPLGSHFELYHSSLARSERWLHSAGGHLRFTAALLRDLLGRPLVNAKRISAEQARRIQMLAGASGLSAQSLGWLERLTCHSTLRMIQRVLRLRQQAPSGGYLYQSASAIHQLLMSSGQAVPYYVFGHTHQSTRLPLPSPGEPAFYLNAGSWIGMDFPGGAAPGKPGEFHFGQITIQPGRVPLGEIRTWDDAQGQPCGLLS